MNVPAVFAEDDPDLIAAFLIEHPMAQLVTMTAAGLVATPLPMLYEARPAGLGSLVGHVARANPQWFEGAPGVEALAIFTGPNAYVSPNGTRRRRSTERSFQRGTTRPFTYAGCSSRTTTRSGSGRS